MTFAQAHAILKPRGLSLTRHSPEYRVAFAGFGHESSAYYTEDLDDAVGTGLDMAKRASGPGPYCRCDGHSLGGSDHCSTCGCEELEERCAYRFERATGKRRADLTADEEDKS